MVYSTRLFVLCLTLCHFTLVFFSPSGSAITSLGVERANLSMFVRFVLVWICRFSLPLGVWEELRFVIVALPGLFSTLFFTNYSVTSRRCLGVAESSMLTVEYCLTEISRPIILDMVVTLTLS